jgi:geranylgeranyl reductase family protein
VAHTYDVAVVGGGPSGSSCGYWLANAGFDVAIIEKKHFPREKTCGDGLTPRAVHQLDDMGLSAALASHHYYRGLRAFGFGRSLELEWPQHPEFPSYGYVITRHDLDQLVCQQAERAGATVLQGAAVTNLDRAPDGQITALGLAPGATGNPEEIRARYVVVADGSNSRIGRELGVTRNRSWPQGMAIRGYWESPRHDEPWIESHLDIADAAGEILPGYGWVFPLGDGRINLGVGLLSFVSGEKGANTTKLLQAFLAKVGGDWKIEVDAPCAPATGGRLPMGLALGPRVGPNYLLVGDAMGAINPFNGEGISYAYETGRLAAEILGEALHCADPGRLADFDQRVEDTYGDYYRVGRAFVRLIGRPEIMKLCVGQGMRSRHVMEVVMRVMANLLRPDSHGLAESAMKATIGLAHLKDLVKSPGTTGRLPGRAP